MNKYLYLFVCALFPALVLAANDHNFDTNIVANGITVNMSGNADQLVVNPGSFDVTLSPGGSVTVTAAGKNIISNTLGAQTTCGLNNSTAVLSWGNEQSVPFTVTVTPQSGTCAGDSGGTISSGGGGGGSSVPATPTSNSANQLKTLQDQLKALQDQAKGLQGLQKSPKGTSIGVPVPSTSSTVVAGSLTRDLNSGAQNNEVKLLQQLLAKDKEIYPEGIVSGYFGPKTTAAVKRFQKKYGIPQVGKVGPATRKKLNEVFGGASAPAVAPASSSNLDQLKTLQDQLKALQDQAKGLQKPAVVTPPPAPTPVPTSRLDQLKALQDQLKALQDQAKGLQKK